MSLLEALSYGNCCLTSDIPEWRRRAQGRRRRHARRDVPRGRRGRPRGKAPGAPRHPDTVAAFGKDAAAYVTGRYNWDAITRQTLNTYKGEDQ